MDNQTIIDQLKKSELLSVCELLVSCLQGDDNLWEIDDWELFSELPVDVINYCDKLTSYERLCNLQKEELAIERELHQLLTDDKFQAYREVFHRFGFGQRLTAILISQIYPLSGFLGEDGKPEVKIRQGRISKKPTKRHLSLRRFQKALGVAPSLEASGDIRKAKVVGGSDLCRIALWQWVFTRIEPKRSRLKNDIGKSLGEKLDAEKAAGRPVKLVRMKIAAIGTRLLFRELVKALTNDHKLLE